DLRTANAPALSAIVLGRPDLATGTKRTRFSQSTFSHLAGDLPTASDVGLFYPLDRIRRRAGLSDVRLHDLRHSFASFLVASQQEQHDCLCGSAVFVLGNKANETLSLLGAQETLPVGLGCGGNTGCGVHGGSSHTPFAGQFARPAGQLATRTK